MIKKSTYKSLIVFSILLAIAVFARQTMRRGAGTGSGKSVSPERFEISTPELQSGERTRLLRLARETLTAGNATEAKPRDGDGTGRVLAFVSLSRQQETAWIVRGEGPSPEQAVARGAEALAQRATPDEVEHGRLKLDLAVERSELETFDSRGRATIDPSLEGLWLPSHDILLLPEELMARDLMDDADLQSKRLRRYLKNGGRAPIQMPDNPAKAGMSYFRVRFESFLEGPDLPIELFRGNDREPEVTAESLLEASLLGGEYLIRHQRADGSFNYNYFPPYDEVDDKYNLLRHAGTCYSLVELYQATDDERFLTAARQGLAWLRGTVRGPKPEHAEAGFEAIVSPGEEAKLGGAALALLALTQYRQAGGEGLWTDGLWGGRLGLLARFLNFQQGADGRFESKYFYGEPDPEPFESIYYPGEAILALSRLYRQDPQPEWLATARRAADWLIDVRDAGKSVADLPHDHWLLMGLEELHQLTEDPRYLDHAQRIAQAIVDAQRTASEPLDWRGAFRPPPRTAPAATRGEALVAMWRLAERNGVDNQPYLDALRAVAAFQLRTQITADNALYLPRPDRALGGFRRSLTRWDVRIDYVQHNLSALLGLRAILLEP